MPLTPVFNLKLNLKVLPGMVTVGKYDGVHPCLTCATTAGKVFIHNPHRRSDRAGRLSEVAGDVSLLSINQSVSSIAAGPMLPNSDKDILLVGSATNVLAYDVDNNADLFYKEAPDGARACIVGKLGGYSNPLALIGGNCSLSGFDHTGNESFWSVTGDNVYSLALVDFTANGENELIVGSEDFDIRVFHQDEIIHDMTETEVVTNLCPIQGSRFGYGLSNGTVGVYEKSARYWRIKSKNHPVSIYAYDIDSNGVPELITGWSNGKLDARTDRTGEVIFKHNFASSLAGIVESDYKMDGKSLLMAVSTEGEVSGWEQVPTHLRSLLLETINDMASPNDLVVMKKNLLLELRNYEQNRTAGSETTMDRNKAEMGVIPANTQLQTSLTVCQEKDKQCIRLCVSTTNDTIIRAVLIFAEGIFDGESYVVHPPASQMSCNMEISIVPPKDIPVDLHIKALVGYKVSSQFHVFELTRQLPRFSMYGRVQEAGQAPKGYVQFQVQERVKRVVMWINQNFLLDADLEAGKGDLTVYFVSLRSGAPLHITMDTKGQITIHTDDIELAGDIVQALCIYLNLEDVLTICEFPEVTAHLKDLLVKVDEYQSMRQRLVAEMADHSNLIKSLVVRAEDSRMMCDMGSMKKAYLELYDLNRDLISGYKVRSTNHQELLACLKQVNQIIQRAGNLRVGRYKSQTINLCRNAIKNNNIGALVKIVRTGQD